MRHSSIDLTMSRYTHTLAGQESDAVEALPDVSAKPAEAVATLTGTDDAGKLCAGFAQDRAKNQLSPDFAGQKPICSKSKRNGGIGILEPKTAVSGHSGGEAGRRTSCFRNLFRRK